MVAASMTMVDAIWTGIPADGVDESEGFFVVFV